MKISHLIASGALFLSMAAFADGEATFDALDADGNGIIDQQESTVDADLAKHFETADQDKDGALSEDEFAYAMAEIRAEKDMQRNS